MHNQRAGGGDGIPRDPAILPVVLSVAYGANRYALYRWWRVRGGLGG